MKRQTLVGVFVLLAAAAANADPTLNRVDSLVTKTGGVTLTVEAGLSAAGKVEVTGDVNGKTVLLRKKLKAGTRTAKFTVSPTKLRLKKLTTALTYTLHVTASETGGVATSTQDVSETVPVPCIVLPGLANEQTPVAFDAFAAALDLAAGGRYGFGGASPSMRVFGYPSLTQSLAALGKGLDKAVKATLKGTPFAKVDLVGYSYGGVVARSYMAQKGGARVRELICLGSPHEGSPLAYIGVFLLNNGELATLLGANPQFATAVGGLLNDGTKQSLRNLYPTYNWVSPTAAMSLLTDDETPLTALNASPPPAGVTAFYVLYYSGTGVPLGTVDVVNSTLLLAAITGGELDPAAVATGSGDGVVPARSARMDDVPAWKAVITAFDMGNGTHVTMPADPAVIAKVASLLLP